MTELFLACKPNLDTRGGLVGYVRGVERDTDETMRGRGAQAGGRVITEIQKGIFDRFATPLSNMRHHVKDIKLEMDTKLRAKLDQRWSQLVIDAAADA